MKDVGEAEKQEMFSMIDDPLKSQWWETTWKLLHKPAYGPVISAKSPPMEKALWLITLRDLHAVYESRLWDCECETMYVDWWACTGFTMQDLACYLFEKGLISIDEEFSEDNESHYDEVMEALYGIILERRKQIYPLLLKEFGSEQEVRMFMVGGKETRSYDDEIARVYFWTCDKFEF